MLAYCPMLLKSMPEVILSLTNVTKRFSSTPLPAVANISLNLYQGELLSLLGPSGCGKTTLLRLIAGFEQPDRGQIFLGTTEIACAHCAMPPERREVGMVFQDYALFPHLTVEKNIAFGLKQKRNLSVSQANDRVQTVINLVGLDGLAQRYPHEISGGQQQRVALARALAPNPSLILLDEPLSNLDVQVRLRLRQELRSILKAAGTSAILVTHDQEEALSISDRVAVLRRGQIEQIDTPEQIYTEPATRFVAEFVTQANFLPARRLDHTYTTWETAFGPVVVPEWMQLHEDQGILMVRQEDVQLKPSQRQDVVVHDRQFLGREHRYSLQTLAGQELIARTSANQGLEVGTPVEISFNSETLRLFPDRRVAHNEVYLEEKRSVCNAQMKG